MSTSVSFNGTTYSIPASGETGWSGLSSFLIDVANNAQTTSAQRGTIRIATSTPVTVSSTDYTVLSDLTVPGAVAVTLPAGVDKTIYVIGDANGDAQTYNITITPASGNINGSSTYVIKNNYGVVALQYSTAATEWKVIGRYFTKIDAANEVYGILGAANGGTGIANNAAATLTRSGNHALTLTTTNTTSLTLPTSGTLTTTSDKLSVFAATTSSELAGVISDETGSGSLVFGTSPTLTTPVLGVATATSINKVALTSPATSATLTIADGKTLTASNTLTLTGTDASSVAFGTGGTVTYTSNNLSVFAATTSAQLAGVISDESGSGSLVFANTPTLVTPVLGVASATSVNKVAITAPATSATLTIADGKTLTASNTLTFTGTDSSSVAFGAGGTVAYTGGTLAQFAATTSAQLAGVISDETGSGALVFGTSPTLATPAVTTSLAMNAAAETRYYNAGGTFYTGFKGGNASANKIWTLPLADGGNGQVLKTDGSATLSWGTAAASGSINYVSESDFEDNAVTGWATYADAAATTPVNGTGGSPNSTFAATSSGPLRGTYSGLFTKGAANRQGEGFSYDFTIATADVSRPLAISWEGSASANYTGSSGSEYMVCYVYDVTNSVLIATSTVNVAQGATKGYTTFLATTSTSYRLIFHVAGTGTSAWTYLIDSVSVSPYLTVQGAALSDPVSFTPTGTWTANTTYTGSHTRSGKMVRLNIDISLTGAPTSATLHIDFPSFAPLDTTTPGYDFVTTRKQILGKGLAFDATGLEYPFLIFYDTSNGKLQPYYQSTSGASGDPLVDWNVFNATTPVTWANNDNFTMTIEYPVSTWSSNVQMADRAVEEYAYNSDVTSTASITATGFANGIAGVAISTNWSSAGTAYTRRVRFSNPIQQTDKLVLQLSNNSVSPVIWVPINDITGGYVRQNGNDYGVKLLAVSGSSTDIDVQFQAGGPKPDSTYAANGTTWSGYTGFNWHLKKVSGGASVGYPIAPANISLINSTENYSGNTKMGLMDYFHGTTYNNSAAPTVSGPGGFSNIRSYFTPYQKADGRWFCKVAITCSATSAASFTFSVNGLVSKNTSSFYQCGTHTQVNDATTYFIISYIGPNSGDFFVKYSASITSPNWFGDIELESKPTWAY